MAEWCDETFNAAEWLSAPGNFALQLDGNMVLFEQTEPAIYNIHWLLLERGSAAFLVAIDLLRHAFEVYGALAIHGLVPASNRASRWFSRQLGCKSHGVVETSEGEQELFSMTRQEFEARYGFSQITEGRQQLRS